MIKKRYDDFEIHMSTQASIMNKAATQYFYEQGASRIVLARENTLEAVSYTHLLMHSLKASQVF